MMPHSTDLSKEQPRVYVVYFVSHCTHDPDIALIQQAAESGREYPFDVDEDPSETTCVCEILPVYSSDEANEAEGHEFRIREGLVCVFDSDRLNYLAAPGGSKSNKLYVDDSLFTFDVDGCYTEPALGITYHAFASREAAEQWLSEKKREH